MIDFRVGLFCALMVANPLLAATNSVSQATVVATAVTETNSAVEAEFQKLENEDDSAMAEVDRWIKDNQKFAAQGAGVPNAELNQRIRARLNQVRKAYDGFISRHPSHVGARLAYASFLEDDEDEAGALVQLKKAHELAPNDPATWNNLANHYGHSGKVKKAFEYYAKAIELKPDESVYYQNFATTVYLFRKDAMEYFKISEQQVFDKALELYEKALKFDPKNFNLATDLAQTYYAIRPVRTDDALRAWTNALAIAHDEIEREGVYIHFARFKWLAGRTNEARAHLNAVTNQMYATLKQRLLRHLDQPDAKTATTNTPPVAVDKK